MALSDADAARLAALRAARDKLISGQQTSKVASGPSVVEFAAGNIDAVMSEIARLEARERARPSLGAMRFRIL